MTTYNDLYEADKGIFNAMNHIHQLDFLGDEITPQEADSAFSFLNGDKELLNNYMMKINTFGNERALDKLARMLLNIYEKKWNDLYQEFIQKHDFSSKETITETVENEGNESKKGSEKNKISAYDEEELLTDTGTDTDNSTDTTGTQTRTYEKTTNDLKSYEENLFLLQDKIFYEIIFTDICTMLFGHIY